MTDARRDQVGDRFDTAGPAVADAWRPTEAPRRSGAVARGLEVGCLGLGVVLIVALFFQYLDIYFMMFDTKPVVTPYDEHRYLVTVTACVALLVIGAVAALVGGHPRVFVLGLVLLVVGLLAAALFAVPTGRWSPEPADVGPGPDYHPCYSGSNDCVGG